ncbi:TMEM165/GDT1 family protein [Permianibacter sp. IMCC34836]|uniref:TMEM165/GDT1 family protein n=1 Tax=Permianibacter fluminis TaxID=2738515 RepID=UPI0015542769|nr:TMEM165/GDT1 family protein [Permianibacter fluminis]NQD36167.1 TMEM165/GDT1 family protein [Permianibacter fluminis]
MAFLSALFSAFVLVFVAELGDKTQLACMTLATRYPARKVLLGVSAAFVLLSVLAVTVGKLLTQLVPAYLLSLVVALLFFWFAWQALQAEPEEDTGPANGHKSAVMAAFSMIFFAELGDKTQLATAGLATELSVLAVAIGAAAALITSAALAIWAGKQLRGRLSPRVLARGAAALFALFGLLALWRALDRGLLG